eukprot:scaffold110058_cov75-Phaeocystis_antarctica.AAC.2
MAERCASCAAAANSASAVSPGLVEPLGATDLKVGQNGAFGTCHVGPACRPLEEPPSCLLEEDLSARVASPFSAVLSRK